MKRIAMVLPVFVLMAVSSAQAQSEPYRVFDTRPVILEGPYLIATGETTATVVWLTDTPSHAKVLYSALGQRTQVAEAEQSVDGSTPHPPAPQVAEPQVDGLVPVGLRHVVHLTGLAPGTTYQYEVVATRVVRLNAYWPDKGLEVRSGPHTFTTLDRNSPTAFFTLITDTHEDIGRIEALNEVIDWGRTEFVVHLGDAFHWLDDEEQLFRAWLRPMLAGLGASKPLLFVRGNHELRGPFARHLRDYVPTPEGRFYYARDAGPVHLIVLDTGEDKPDDTNVYAGLVKTVPYRAEELAWFRGHLENERRVAEAPFRVVLMHQPGWGWLEQGNEEWMEATNAAGVDLVISGHRHRFSYTPPGPGVPHRYHLLVLGQDQVAEVEATQDELKLRVKALDGSVVDTVAIPRR